MHLRRHPSSDQLRVARQQPRPSLASVILLAFHLQLRLIDRLEACQYRRYWVVERIQGSQPPRRTVRYRCHNRLSFRQCNHHRREELGHQVCEKDTAVPQES